MPNMTVREFAKCIGLDTTGPDYVASGIMLKMLCRQGIAKEVGKINTSATGRKSVVYELPDSVVLPISSYVAGSVVAKVGTKTKRKKKDDVVETTGKADPVETTISEADPVETTVGEADPVVEVPSSIPPALRGVYKTAGAKVEAVAEVAETKPVEASAVPPALRGVYKTAGVEETGGSYDYNDDDDE